MWMLTIALLMGSPATDPPGIELPEEAASEDAQAEDTPPDEGLEEPDDEPPLEPAPDFIEQPTTPPGRGRKRHLRRRAPARTGNPIYGPLLLSGGLIAGPNNFGFDVGLTRFVVPYVGIGVGLEDIIYFDSPITFNEFVLEGHTQFILLPYRRVTPYLGASFGLDVFSAGGGVYGRWGGSGGLILRVGKRQQYALRAGINVVGDVPDKTFSRAFTCGIVDTPCSLRLGADLGFGVRFGDF